MIINGPADEILQWSKEKCKKLQQGIVYIITWKQHCILDRGISLSHTEPEIRCKLTINQRIHLGRSLYMNSLLTVRLGITSLIHISCCTWNKLSCATRNSCVEIVDIWVGSYHQSRLTLTYKLAQFDFFNNIRILG